MLRAVISGVASKDKVSRIIGLVRRNRRALMLVKANGRPRVAPEPSAATST